MAHNIDNFITPLELAVTAGSLQVTGPKQPTGTVLPGSGGNTVPISRQISLNGTTNHPAAAIVVKESPLVLLTTPSVNSPTAQGLQYLTLVYLGPPPTDNLDAQFPESKGMSVRLNTAGRIKISIVLFPTNGASARRWSWGFDIDPGPNYIEIPWSEFTQVESATNPGAPNSEPILKFVIKFTITHPQQTPLLLENVNLY